MTERQSTNYCGATRTSCAGRSIGKFGSSPEVEDLRQIVMLRVVGAIADFREDATFLTWLRGICTNVVRDDWRTKRACRLTPTEQLDLESTVVAPDTAVSARERLAQAGAALEQLSEEHRTALILQRVLGHSVREIAELTDSAESTTRLRLYYARRAFARALADPAAADAAPHSTAAQPTPEPASPRSDQRFARCNTFGTSFDSLGEELERQQTPLGRVQVWTRSGRVLCTRYTGHIGPDLALCFTRRADRAIDEHGEVITFHD